MLLRAKIYLISILYLFGILFTVFYPPRNFEQSGAKTRVVRSFGDDLKYNKRYVDYTKLVQEVNTFSKVDLDMVRLVNLTPPTYEDRYLISLELRSDIRTKKPGILVVGALNGMAWGVPNALMEITSRLLFDGNYQTPFFNDYDWYIIPMANPDGIQFTQNLQDFLPINELVWSKNVSARSQTRPEVWHKNVDRENPQDLCFGTNINRNFAYHWQDDVQRKPARCSQYYPGSKPFSTTEAKAIRKYVENLGDIIKLAIHLDFSYVPKKEFILYPWRYTTRLPSNHHILQEIGEYAARLSRLPNGRLYEVHQSSRDHKVAGSLSDFLAGVVGTDLVFLIKPYHHAYPNFLDMRSLETFTKKSISVIFSLVRGWRSSTHVNTLSFFGTDIEF